MLRNNITTKEHPLGVYHPHAKLHHIKKENIGLIEVMGLAVLPARLKDEMAQLKTAILSRADLRSNEVLSKHADWVEEFCQNMRALRKKISTGLSERKSDWYSVKFFWMPVYTNAPKKEEKHFYTLLTR